MKKASNTDSYLHILKYISLFGGVQVLNVLIGIVRNKFVAMLLGPQGVGLISLFNSTTKLISDSTNFGISCYVVLRKCDEATTTNLHGHNDRFYP